MNTIIYNFSGTGNTTKICNLFQENLIKGGLDCVIYNLKTGFENCPDPEDFDNMCIAYPIHGFNAPQIVIELAKLLPEVNNKHYYIIKTSGEPLVLNSASSSQLVRILKSKGYLFGGEFHYVMPYNMIFRHDDYMVNKMWQAAKKAVPLDTKAIINKKYYQYEPSITCRIISEIFRIEHPAMHLLGRFYKVDSDKCTDCGSCIKNCPMNNISLVEENIVFGSNCIGCVRCSFNCPQNAISIGILNKWKVNGAYNFDANSTEGKVCDYCHDAYCNYFESHEIEIEDELIYK